MTQIRTALETSWPIREDTKFFWKKKKTPKSQVNATKLKGPTTKVNSIPPNQIWSDGQNLLKFLDTRSSEVTINTPHSESSGRPHLSTCKTQPTQNLECCWPRETSCCRLLSFGRRLAAQFSSTSHFSTRQMTRLRPINNRCTRPLILNSFTLPQRQPWPSATKWRGPKNLQVSIFHQYPSDTSKMLAISWFTRRLLDPTKHSSLIGWQKGAARVEGLIVLMERFGLLFWESSTLGKIKQKWTKTCVVIPTKKKRLRKRTKIALKWHWRRTAK